MSEHAPDPPQRALPEALAEAPALVSGIEEAVLLWPDGEVETAACDAVAARLRAQEIRPVVCHAPATARRLGLDRLDGFDLLELFAFIRPAAFCLPTPAGLAAALGRPHPTSPEASALVLGAAMLQLLDELRRPDPFATRRAEGGDDRRGAIAWTMARAGWPWGPAVLAALGLPEDAVRAPGAGLDVWRDLKEWSEMAPEPPPGTVPVDPAEARRRLAEMLGPEAEERPSQADYASGVSQAFRPRDTEDAPNLVLAEAGTGVGKTLGYLAPATLWAEKNGAAVWVSTFTRNLQHQIDDELTRLFPSPEDKARRVVIRKGRENYLCLLNLEESVGGLGLLPRDAVAVGLMARWAQATRDGDMTGGDYPAWLTHLLGRPRTTGLADQRGECIYSACPHYHRCYIERSVRRARRADIVVANHALVLIQAALGGLDDATQPTRYVFDEGHHLFQAADSAFSSHITGLETAELRRWLLGAEGRRSRARGLRRRVEDLIGGLDEAVSALDEIERTARALPGDGWRQRLADGKPRGPGEAFLALVRQQVYARVPSAGHGYALEVETNDPVPGLLEAARRFAAAIVDLAEPVKRLRGALAERLEAEADELDTATRLRIESVCRSLQRRGTVALAAWRDMLEELGGEPPGHLADWFSVERDGSEAGRDLDVGMHRHWIDPARPLAEHVLAKAHGVVVTSATLRDGSGDVERDWAAAEARSGAVHLALDAVRLDAPSPFDYPRQTRVFVVRDVRKDDLGQVAAAYRVLFQAAGGGALGLFTAISRLRAVHAKIAGDLEADGLSLYAQHVDGLDVATLIDIFRAEQDACLLGTDAVRDGVDVPGRSLRLIVFDRVPWPRPDILHRRRREAYPGGRRAYDDLITRLRIKQAFGRLVRRNDDQGVFVLLDPMMPSRLSGAFPDGVEVVRTGLADVVSEVRGFLSSA